jgi:hypothetical protein
MKAPRSDAWGLFAAANRLCDFVKFVARQTVSSLNWPN